LEEKREMEQRFLTVVDILVPFSQADYSVQEKFCSKEVLQRMQHFFFANQFEDSHSLNNSITQFISLLAIKTLLNPGVIPANCLLKLLRIIKNVAPDLKLRTLLTENGIVEVLVKLLEERKPDKATVLPSFSSIIPFYYQSQSHTYIHIKPYKFN
jgi:hypothetical protein